MDCLQAREIVSEAFDRGVEATLGAAEAREHCRSCEECRAFVAGLVALRDAPRPSAPPDVVEAVLERARRMAEADAEDTAYRAAAAAAAPNGDGSESPSAATPTPTGGPVGWEPDVAAPAPPRPRERYWWVPRAAAFAAAAAVVLVAVVVTVQGFRALSGAEGGASLSKETASGSVSFDENAPAAAPLAGAPAAATSGTVNGASAPRYVAYDGVAWVSLGERTLDRTTLQQVGTLTSSTDTTGTPARDYNVWTSKTDQTVLFIELETDRWLAFQLVSRMRGGKRYALSAESGVTGYGQWPTLPSGMTVPEKADGSPSLTQAGTDDTGLPIYVPLGAVADAGFSVAPGTAPTDPAAGNPNWTWWVPKP